MVVNKAQAKLLTEAWGALQSSKKIEWLVGGARSADRTAFSVVSNQVYKGAGQEPSNTAPGWHYCGIKAAQVHSVKA